VFLFSRSAFVLDDAGMCDSWIPGGRVAGGKRRRERVVHGYLAQLISFTRTFARPRPGSVNCNWLIYRE
jgi:hypothetical protein